MFCVVLRGHFNFHEQKPGSLRLVHKAFCCLVLTCLSPWQLHDVRLWVGLLAKLGLYAVYIMWHPGAGLQNASIKLLLTIGWAPSFSVEASEVL